MEYSYQSCENDLKYKSKPSLTLKKKIRILNRLLFSCIKLRDVTNSTFVRSRI